MRMDKRNFLTRPPKKEPEYNLKDICVNVDDNIVKTPSNR